MSLVDLHVHTTYSDGHDTPSEVVKQAVDNKVSVIAVTDHDNLVGLDEAMVEGRELGVTVIPGVEISTGFHGGRLHILGLGVDHNDVAFKIFLRKIYDHRRDVLVAKLGIMNKNIDTADFAASQGEYFNHEKAAQYLVEKGFANDPQKAIMELFNIRVNIEFPVGPADVIKAVHAAHGLVILAHPFARGASLSKLDPTADGQEKLMKELIDIGIDGFECYQSEHSPEVASSAVALADKLGQLVSGGSDWHGVISKYNEDIKKHKSFYPDRLGGLGITSSMVAPLLARLGVPREAEAEWGVFS